MCPTQNAFGIGTRLEHKSLGEEAVESHPRRIVGEKAIAARKCRDAFLDLARRILGGHARIDRNAAADFCPRRHR